MNQAILVTVDLGKAGDWTAKERSLELSYLVASAGARVSKELIVNRRRPDPACFIGTGKAGEIAILCHENKTKMVIFNNDLTGTQQKNLENMIGAKVLDRTQVILDIFARHAHSNEGKLQVELAQLLYMLPRLTGKGIELSRLGGGIGTRGPGEQKLETDRRRIRARISRLRLELEDLKKRRAMMRKKRERFSMMTAAIIGYTNVGKSTLLNALTDSDVIVQDKLFSTLDPTVRRFILPNKQKILFIDTVGFLNELPHHLIEAFNATLEEVAEADILLNVFDVSYPRANQQQKAVKSVLREIGAADKPVLNVLNKIDKVSTGELSDIINRFDNAVAVSALKKEGFGGLIEKILAQTCGFLVPIKIMIPSGDVNTVRLIYENGLVIKREYEDGLLHIEAEVPPRIKALLDKRQG